MDRPVIGGTLRHLDGPRRALYEHTRAVARDRLAPIAARGEDGKVNRELVEALADEGLLARLLPADGVVSVVDLCVVREALATESAKAETAFALQGLGSFPILTAGAPEAVEAWMPRVTGGTAVAAFALTETGAGSDVRAMALEATRDGADWRLSGEKTFISNAPEADVYTVFARMAEPVDDHRPIIAFAVPAGSDGLTGEPLSLIGGHPIGTLTFDEVPVAEENVLGAPGEGLGLALATLDVFRPTVGAGAVGMAQHALELATEHASVRHAFGRPLAGFQAVSHALADMATQTHAARLLVHDAAQAADAGEGPIRSQSAMAKLMATETAQRAIDAAVQIHGATALRTDHPLSHLYQDVRALRIYEGTSEIQRDIIARGLQPRR